MVLFWEFIDGGKERMIYILLVFFGLSWFAWKLMLHIPSFPISTAISFIPVLVVGAFEITVSYSRKKRHSLFSERYHRSLEYLYTLSLAIGGIGLFTLVPFFASFLLLGVMMNKIAVFSNGFRMPAVSVSVRDGIHVPMTENTRVRFLCEWITDGFFFRGVAVSPGDIVLLVGFYVGVFEIYAK